MIPIWGAQAITVQPTRAGLPCFGAALVGYVEATVDDDDVKNRLCPPSPLPNSPADWVAMQVDGMGASRALAVNPDARAWGGRAVANPSHVYPELAGSAELAAERTRFRSHVAAAVARMAELVAMTRVG